MTLTEWGNQLVSDNVPFKPRGRTREGLDCLGIPWLCFKELKGILLPSYTDIYTESDVRNLKQVGIWIEERANEWVEVDREQPFDCVLLKLYGRPIHVGLVIEPGLMLHIERGINVCYEPYQTSRWRHRIFGLYRHPSCCGHAPV